jgi:pimeloyl-ACP methyl ester carboxylesterase
MKDSSLTLSSGLRLCYAEFGDPEGVPTFYFHGWPCSRLHAWTMHEAALKQGIRLICPDRPGLGLSDDHPERQLLDWPPVIEELSNHLGWEKFHIIGVSGGGPYALVCAALIPQRLLSTQVVCGAPPIDELGTQDLFWIYRLLIRLRKVSTIALGLVLGFGAELASKHQHDFPLRNLVGLLSPSDQTSLQNPGHFNAMALSFRHAVRNGTRALITDADIYLNPWNFRFSDITTPVHFWHGKQDRNIAWTYAEKIANQIPNAITHWFDDEGHYSLPVNQAPNIFAQVLAAHPTDAFPTWLNTQVG